MNLSDYALQPVDELPEVKLMPEGTYIWSIMEVPETKISAKGNHDVMSVKVMCVGVPDNFENPNALEDFGDPTGERRTLFFTVLRSDAQVEQSEAEMARQQARQVESIRRFLFDHCGVEADNLAEAMSSCVNHQFLGYVGHEQDNRDEKQLVDRISRTMPVE